MKKYVFFLFCYFIAGCSTFSEKVPCPHTAILAEFSKVIDLKKKIPVRTEMDSLHPSCERRGDQIYVNLKLRTTSLRPLSTFDASLQLSPSFFVAVVDEKGDVLSYSTHNLEVGLEEKQTTKVNFVQIQETVPSGKNVAIYLGFNLDEAQLDFFHKERIQKVHDNRP